MRGQHEQELLARRHALEELAARIGVVIQGAFKLLFETKHLYQSTRIDLSSLLADAPKFTSEIGRFASGPWLITESGRFGYTHNGGFTSGFTEETIKIFAPLGFTAPHGIKIFCASCGEREAFNPMRAVEVSPSRETVDLGEELPSSNDSEPVMQVFLVAYTCQRCKGAPDAFLVRREGVKLTLCGRAPMEHIEVPREIPKEVERWYRDALIAYQSGKTLAGLLYLRTIIEQWARKVTGSKVPNGDQLMSEYLRTLPPVLTEHFDSMRELYGQLSEPLHAATEDSSLFEDAREKIHLHFRARDLHRKQVEEHYEAWSLGANQQGT